MQKLPVGRQNFKQIRENNYLYVDKTKYIHEMINRGDINFLSRPRRFGKSLLVSTLKELFQGNKSIFKNLYIYDKWKWDKVCPVILLDFGGGNYETTHDLENTITDILDDLAEDFDIELNRITLSKRFGELIKKVYQKTGQKVVVLIDEYDKPIIENLQNEHLEDIENKLGSFYEVLKVNDEFIRFTFITGVSKFVHVSVFSKLNSLKDLTLNDKSNSICGYTQVELESNFQDYIKILADKFNCSHDECLNYIKAFYNGYSWNGKEKVYNPFSTLLCFDECKFSKNWFNSGTPRVLAEYPISKHDIKSIAEPTKLNETDIKNPTTKNIKDEVFLFQTGYLTISNVEFDGVDTFYTLEIPNREVESGLFENLIGEYSDIPLYDVKNYAKKLLKYLIEGNCKKIEETIGDYLSPIPSVLRGQDERYYHVLIFMLLLSSRIHVHSEVRSYKGDADLIIEENDYVIIVEFKQSTDSSTDYMIKKRI